MATLRQLLPAPVRHILRKARAVLSPPSEDALKGFVGMTSLEERDYYAAAMRQVARLPGSVVDLGCWMGSTALSLAHGQEANNTPVKILAYDLFRWDPWMDDHASELWCDYLPGESFLPEARRRVRTRKEIELVAADLSTYEWTQGPIRLLLVDAMKSWELCGSIAKSFFPSLVPGSLLIHQDYQCYNTVWIPVLQYRLRDCFRFAHGVKRGCTVAFETIRTPQPQELIEATRRDTVTNDEVTAAINYSAGLLGKDGRAAMAGCHVCYLADTGQHQAAASLAAVYEGEGVQRRGGFALALGHIQSA